ncbi:MAG: pyrroloquinoline-quinone synthase PqqC [Myxococcales bacterium]|nr:pyrroloquinoline-quinone synthase PqqC [Myxococcales bacterium]
MTHPADGAPRDEAAFLAALRELGARKYHDKHGFHQRMNEGRLSPEQLQVWALNRFYYQRMIPVKDCALMAEMPTPEHRRRWRQRLLDQDGPSPDEPGGIEAWLRLVEATGATRDEAWSGARLLPGVRFAVDAYVNFVRTRPWVEGVASSLTELFSPQLMTLRIAAFEEHYPWVAREGLTYFRGRPKRASNDSDHALEIVFAHCKTRAEQDRALAALDFKCDLLWAQLDAIDLYCGRW